MPRAFTGKELRAAIKKQVRAGYLTKGGYANEAMPLIIEYMTRKQLAALGFQQRLEDLDFITAETMMVIDLEYASLMAEEQKKALKRKGGR